MRQLATQIAPFLRDNDPRLRIAAIRTLASEWQLGEFRAGVDQMWRTDPDEATRAEALAAWAHYDHDTKSPATIRRLYQTLCDDREADAVRRHAYSSMFDVFGLPRPTPPNPPIGREMDWGAVDRMVRESGATTASEAAVVEVSEITYRRGVASDPINGCISITLEREDTFEVEHVHGARRVWRGILAHGVWSRVLAAMEINRFPAPPKDQTGGLVPGTQFIQIGWRRNSVLEQVSYPAGTPRYRDISMLLNTLAGQLDKRIGIDPPDAPVLIASAHLVA
jgi:hypothetical protein